MHWLLGVSVPEAYCRILTFSALISIHPAAPYVCRLRRPLFSCQCWGRKERNGNGYSGYGTATPMMSNITTSSECEDNKASVIGERTNRGSEEHGNIFSLLVVSTHMEFVQRKK